jgi:cysteine synthase B
MGTTGTIMGVSRYLKEQNPRRCRSSACNRPKGACIAGIRRWPLAYLPKIYDPAIGWIDMDGRRLKPKTSLAAWHAKRASAAVSPPAAAVAAALRSVAEVENAVIVTIICDRGDRYLSTGLFG